MKIYVSHSKHFDFKNELYKVLEESDLSQEFIFPHKDSDSPYNSKELFKSKGCDLVLAEVSHPATGQGIELGWADTYNLPIICVYKKGSAIASSLGVISNYIFEYENPQDMVDQIRKYLENI